MKIILTILITTATCAIAFGQSNDTTFVSIGQDTTRFEKQRFIDRYDYVFGTHQPARWIFKWDAGSMLPVDERGLRLDAEYKISQAISINASYGLGFSMNSSLFDGGDLTFVAHRFRAESRWYFDMRRRILDGRSANNFSGNYLGLEWAQDIRIRKSDATLPQSIYHGVSARFGIQRRLFRYGYFDISYGIGFREYPQTVFYRGRVGIYTDARLGVGFALTSPKPEMTDKAAYCNVFQCFREEKRMFKIDLFNLFRAATLDRIQGSLRMAVEQKLGESPFSIEGQIKLDGSYYSFEYDRYNNSPLNRTFKSNTIGVGGHLQGRYYYGLKRRIATGKSGNNLSGAYFAGQVDLNQSNTQYTTQNSDGTTSKQAATFNRKSAGLLWGIQHRIFDNGFVDLNFGASIGNDKSSSQPKERTLIYLLSALRIGLAF